MKEKKNQSFKPTEKAKKLTALYSPETDPQGSYTGKPKDVDDVPVQDADDL